MVALSEPKHSLDLCARTPARIGRGRSGARPRTSELLLFRADHAAARGNAHDRAFLDRLGQIRVLVFADQFLLLGVDGDHRLAGGLMRFDLRVDVLELRVAIGMASALLALTIDLTAIAEAFEQLRDALAAWGEDVRTGRFPGPKESYLLPEPAREQVRAWKPSR